MSNLNEIQGQLADRATQVREFGARLSDRITIFNNYISKLRGRTTTEYQGDDFRLKVSKKTTDVWHIEILYSDAWHSLVDAPINMKLKAMSCFPDLLLAMLSVHEDLIAKIEKQCNDFDAFFKDVP